MQAHQIQGGAGAALSAEVNASIGRDADLTAWNADVRKLAEAGLITEDYCIDGPILQQLPYGDGSTDHDSGRVIQVFLLAPHGLGVVRWDTEEAAEADATGKVDYESARTRFETIAECSRSERALLARHASALLQKLYAEFDIERVVDGLRISSIPIWDSEKTLFLSGAVIRTVTKRAKNVRKILDAFQNAGWPEAIADPLNNQQLRHRTIEVLNNGLRAIRFFSDENRLKWARL